MHNEENRSFHRLKKLIFTGFLLATSGCFHESESFGLSIADHNLLKTAFERDLLNSKITYQEESGFFYFSPDEIEEAKILYNKLVSKKEETLIVENECEAKRVVKKLSSVIPIVSSKQDGDYVLNLYSDDFLEKNLPKELLEAKLSCQ